MARNMILLLAEAKGICKSKAAMEVRTLKVILDFKIDNIFLDL